MMPKLLVSMVLVCLAQKAAALPAKFDLRDVSGQNYIASVKKQNEGTCWTHGTVAALESNLMLTGAWTTSGESGEANLAEYHLDWWNGFNRHFNKDIYPKAGGLTVHQGGDYRVAAAYLARGEGVVREKDASSFSTAPKQNDPSYKKFYTRDIEWLSAGKNLERIDEIKNAIMQYGAVGTAMTWMDKFYSSAKGTFYQPKTDSSQPNHAVAIVGWDDDKVTQAPQKGAWLIKNSWGAEWGQSGYFWISYQDKISGQHPEMGAVVFRNTEPMRYQRVYFHDYHGWRDTKKDVSIAMNRFVAEGSEMLRAVSFYTAEDNVEYSVRIYREFQEGLLSNEISAVDGRIAHQGFHTVDLMWPAILRKDDKFYVYLRLSRGGQPFDKTSVVPLLLCGNARPTVESKANAGESYFWDGNTWKDFTTVEKTGNFTIKALTTID